VERRDGEIIYLPASTGRSSSFDVCAQTAPEFDVSSVFGFDSQIGFRIAGRLFLSFVVCRTMLLLAVPILRSPTVEFSFMIFSVALILR
jgi:hypothetical protein